jgi:CHAT domain-containing protein
MDDLEQAIALSQAAVDQAPDGFPGRPSLLHNLGTSLRDWYTRTGDLDALEQAIDAHEEAVATTRSGSPARWLHLSGLGIALFDRYRRTGNRNDLDRCISTQQEALAGVPTGSTVRYTCLNTLGNALRFRAVRTNSLEDLLSSIEVLEEAVATSPPNSSLVPVILSNLGLSRGQLADVTRDQSDLDAAIDIQRRADDRTPATAIFRSMNLSVLATSLRARYTRNGDPHDLQAAIAAFRESCNVGLASHTEQVLTTAQIWGAWAVARRSWIEAAEAYEFALQATRDLFEAQLVRRHKETWLEVTRGLHSRAAYATAMAGDAETATLALERGRAMLLSEALERDHADLQRLASLGHQDLADRYWLAADRVAELSRPPDATAVAPNPDTERLEGQRVAALRVTRADLGHAIASIREVPSYERFLAAPVFSDVQASATTGPVVYLASTEAGGLALVVNDVGDGDVRVVWLPALTEEAVRIRSEAFRQAHDRRHQDSGAWLDTIDQVTRWLADAAMTPVLDALGPTERATLIPAGLLGLLPLHAAWTPDPSRPTGRRYALDQVLLTYAPNARASQAAQQLATRVGAGGILAVNDPRPVRAAPLPGAVREIQAALAAFPRSTHLSGEKATKATVLAAVGDHPVLHFACHGYADAMQPLESSLLLAHDEQLRLRDIMDRHVTNARLAVLSACETAIAGSDLPDEVVNLPTGFLQTGMAGVIGSLWSVADISTSLLMVRFYQLWRQNGLAPAEALRRAQQWIRDSTNGEKQAAFPDIPALAGPTGSAVMRAFWADARASDHPYYWAAFTYTGA